MLDGEEVEAERVKQLPQEDIDHITVLKDGVATRIYGERAKDGVVEIGTKEVAKEEAAEEATQDNMVDDKVWDICEEMPEFVGGDAALKEYISRHLTYPSKVLDYGVQGCMRVSFIVEMDGSISNVTAVLSNETGSEVDAVITGFHRDDEIQLNGEIAAQLLHEWAASAEQFFRDMPRWKPGRQNGHVVRARVTFPLHYRLQ
jgi:protein TonB